MENQTSVECKPAYQSLERRVGQVVVYIAAGVAIGLLGVGLLQAFLVGLSSFK